MRIAGSPTLPYDTRLRSLAGHINKSFQAVSTTIYLPDLEGRRLSKKIPDSGTAKIIACSVPLQEGSAGLCAATRKVVTLGSQSLHRDEVFKGTEQSILSLPIVAKKDLYGVISLGLGENVTLSPQEKKVLHDICTVLAALIQSWTVNERSAGRIRSLTALNEFTRMVNQPILFTGLPAVILRACHLYANSCCTILRIIHDNGFMPTVYKKCRQRLRSRLPSFLEIEALSSSETMRDGKPRLAITLPTDTDLPLSHICMPIRNESQMLGTVTFFGKPGDDGSTGKFEEEDLVFLGKMAKVVASALVEATVYRDMALLAAENDKKKKEISLLFQISNSMHSAIKLDELMHFTLNALVAGATPIFERVMLFLVNERAGVIQGMQGVTCDPDMERDTTPAGKDPASSPEESFWKEMPIQKDSSFTRMVKETRIPLDKSLNVASRAVLEKKLIYVNDPRKERPGDREFADLFGLKTFAVVPLMLKGNPVGLVIVDNSLSGRSLAREDFLFLQLLMNQAGTAIENSMLHIRIEDVHRDFREIQHRLIQGEKLAAIGEMAASLAHELKGPLVSIGGLAKRLERKFASDSTERKYSETIVREVARLERMLSDTLFFSKKATICYSPCNIKTIVEESLAIMAASMEDNNIRVKVRFYPGIPAFLGDCQQLKQVMLNLFSNAAESMKNGGTLSVTVATTKLDGDAAISISISDTGGGIPAEILNDIFNPFFTTKECGTGLGLPISNKIVTNHGGKILVHNNPGVGAQFKVILPLHQCIP